MAKLLFLCVIWSAVILIPVTTFSQYILNGNATKESCNCYTLTQPVANQSGSVWQSTRINLNDSFDFSFRVYLGCVENGADGIVFILQPLSTSIGSNGEGLGFAGISPSIGIPLDTYQNTGDPPYDHISIQANGDITHGNDLAGPIPASASGDNIKDCAWHDFRINWNPATHTLSAYFDGVFRVSTQTDLVNSVFNNDPLVYWGFSGSTGGHYNLQKFCTSLEPNLSSGLANDAVCAGSPVAFKDSSNSFTSIESYYWDFGDGTFSTEANPSHMYAQPGIYQVKHSFTAADNCVSEPFTKAVMIGDKPNLSVKIFDTCETLAPRIEVNSSVSVGNIDQWEWKLDGVDFSTLASPDFSKLLPGNHSAELTVESNIGCRSGTYTSDFLIRNKPEVMIQANDECVNVPVLFTAQQTDHLTTINSWHWDFGDQHSSDQKSIDHIYTAPGNYPVLLTATASNGCTNSFSGNILINSAYADAGNDTVILENTFFQLNGSGGSSYSWSPATGLSNPHISNPMVNISDDISYLLTVKSTEGCTDTASVRITIFKGSAVYVPNAFTPNNDGLNDLLKPYFIGIKSLSYFTVFNRWGQKVFTTNDVNKGWDGYFRGTQNDGIYAWTLKAVDLVGKIYTLKGSVMLLK